MTDIALSPRRRTIAMGLASAACALACLAAVPLQAQAEEQEQLVSSNVEEIAGALGFHDSLSPGFWEAYTEAVADQRVAAEEKRVEDANQIIADAAKYGRRVEVTWGRVTSFTEFIPPASDDLVEDATLIRRGVEETTADGTTIVKTRYLKASSPENLGMVVSVIKDGVETVTEVIEKEPGSIDVKVGDKRPVPPPGSSTAGEKPHTLDPKADGSMGRASGGQPDGGAKPADAETMAGEKPWSGRRVEFESIKLPNDRVLTPFLEDKPPVDGEPLPYRTGYDLEHPDWDGAIARITLYFDGQAKAAGVVATVIHGGDETVVAVVELTPGSLGVNEGDSRPAPDNGGKGKVPSTWDPKPSTGSGSTSNSQPEQDSEPSADDRSLPGTSQDTEDEEGPAPSSSADMTNSSANSQSEYEYLGQGPPRQNEDGSTSQNTLYRRTSDDVYVQIITTTQKDGTQSQEQHCIKDSEEVDCGAGLTDEPTCHTDCARLAMLTDLFVCASGGGGIECGEAFEGVGPADYGDPVDPNGAEPVDMSLFVDPRNDGVTDPVSPGESEETVDSSIRLDTYGTLRDPANPPGTEDSAPSPGAPGTGEAERNPLP